MSNFNLGFTSTSSAFLVAQKAHWSHRRSENDPVCPATGDQREVYYVGLYRSVRARHRRIAQGAARDTHWAYTDLLSLVGAKYEKARIVKDGNLITPGGVTAGIDFGLSVVAEIAGETTAQAIQLGMEYDSALPFDCGHPDRAPAAVKSALSDRYTKPIRLFVRASNGRYKCDLLSYGCRMPYDARSRATLGSRATVPIQSVAIERPGDARRQRIESAFAAAGHFVRATERSAANLPLKSCVVRLSTPRMESEDEEIGSPCNRHRCAGAPRSR